MTIIPEQGYMFYVVGAGIQAQCWLPVDDQSDLDSIKEQMVEAGIAAASYGTVLALAGDGDIAQACLRRDGTIRWEMLTEAIRKAERGANISALVAYLEDTSEITLDNFDEEYLGCYDSAADHAEEAAIESGELAQVPERLRPYIDWESVARDAKRSGGIWTRETVDGTHIFRS
jgi:hypothetical protein